MAAIILARRGILMALQIDQLEDFNVTAHHITGGGSVKVGGPPRCNIIVLYSKSTRPCHLSDSPCCRLYPGLTICLACVPASPLPRLPVAATGTGAGWSSNSYVVYSSSHCTRNKLASIYICDIDFNAWS